MTVAPSSESSRTTVERNETRLCRDSTSVSFSSGPTSFRGTPGIPAPDPASRISRASAGTTRRNRGLSRNTCSTIHPGSSEPTKRWTFCHFSNKSRYLRKASCSVSLRSRPRTLRAPDRRIDSGSAPLRAGGVLGLSRRSRRRAVHELLLEDLKHVRHKPIEDESRR